MNRVLAHLENLHGREFTASEIKWAQGANSVAKIEAAIGDSAVQCIELDVNLSEESIPIAAHPPTNESDLTIEGVIERIQDTNKVVKFDFKNKRTVEPTLRRLADHNLTQPVILNADVLTTTDKRAAIDGAWFIDRAMSVCPDGLLSLGWRTTGRRGNKYTEETINEMLELTKNLDEVTFPVRARMLRRSWHQIEELLSLEGRSLTIWNNGYLLDRDKRWIVDVMDQKRCFVACDLSQVTVAQRMGYLAIMRNF